MFGIAGRRIGSWWSIGSVILVISAQAAVIAGLLALADGRFDALSFVLVLLGFVTAHAISNLSNDYFGHRRGYDTPDSPRMRYTMHPIASAAYFWTVRGPLVLAFSLAGLALLYLYDAAPRPLKSMGLGEVAAFLVWGSLMVGGGYFVITGQVSSAAFLAAVPYGLGLMSILVGKHIDQAGFDRAPSPSGPVRAPTLRRPATWAGRSGPTASAWSTTASSAGRTSLGWRWGRCFRASG